MSNLAEMEMRLDDAAFKLFLNNVSGARLKSAMRQGLRKSLMMIKNKAVSNLRAVKFKKGKLNVSKPVVFKKNGKKYILPSFRKGVMIRVAKKGNAGNVSIYKKSNPKDYNLLLAMFHNAKGDRSTKGGLRKAHSTGSVGPHTFFGDAVQQTKGQVNQNLQKNLQDAIRKAQERFLK